MLNKKLLKDITEYDAYLPDFGLEFHRKVRDLIKLFREKNLGKIKINHLFIFQ